MNTKPGTEASATKEPQAKGTHEALPIGQIITDARTQVRAAIDEAIVEEYAEHLRAGGSLPPVTAFRDEASRTYLADGFHRVRAHERAGRTEIDAEIQSGTQEDALWCALGANRAHGHRLTSADKKHAIELALKAWPDRSQTRIAQQIGCSQQYVGKIRGQVTTSCNLPDRTVGEDGKSYPAGRNTPEPTALEDDREDGDGTRPSEMPASAEPKAPGKGERRGTPSRRAQNRSNRIVSVVASDALNLTAQQALIDFRALDREELPEWIRELEDARRKLGGLIRRLKEEVSDANGHGDTGIENPSGSSPTR